MGHKELWIYLALVCLINITGKWRGHRSVCYNLVAAVGYKFMPSKLLVITWDNQLKDKRTLWIGQRRTSLFGLQKHYCLIQLLLRPNYPFCLSCCTKVGLKLHCQVMFEHMPAGPSISGKEHRLSLTGPTLLVNKLPSKVFNKLVLVSALHGWSSRDNFFIILGSSESGKKKKDLVCLCNNINSIESVLLSLTKCTDPQKLSHIEHDY